MNTLEKLEQSSIVKEKGTLYFKVHKGFCILQSTQLCTFSCFLMHWFNMLQEGKYKQASVQYKRIVSWLEHESGLSEEDEKKAKTLRLAAHLNLAMCFLKLQEPNQALESCDKVSNLYCLSLKKQSCKSLCCPLWRHLSQQAVIAGLFLFLSCCLRHTKMSWRNKSVSLAPQTLSADQPLLGDGKCVISGAACGFLPPEVPTRHPVRKCCNTANASALHQGAIG